MGGAFSRGQKLLVALFLVWIVGCYSSLCVLTLFMATGGELSDLITVTPLPTARIVTPLPTYTPYPTSTRTPVPTETPIFPDYFFPTSTPTETPTLVSTLEDPATAISVPTEVPTLVIIPTITKKPTEIPPVSGCTCTGQDLDCPYFKDLAPGSAQMCFNYCKDEGHGDVYGLDREGDNLACENQN